MTGPAKSKLTAQLEPHSDSIRLLAQEADRRLADVNRRLEILASRASFVVGAAAVTAGVELSRGIDLSLILSAFCSLSAASLALPLLRFKRGREVNVLSLLKQIADRSAVELELELINAKMKLVSDAEQWAKTRSRLLLAGLAALGASIAASAVRTIVG